MGQLAYNGWRRSTDAVPTASSPRATQMLYSSGDFERRSSDMSPRHTEPGTVQTVSGRVTYGFACGGFGGTALQRS